MKQLKFLILDILSAPALFLTKKQNALYHLRHICPHCPKYRRALRDVDGDGECWWYENWRVKNYSIPRTFGLKNFIWQYLFLRTDLRKFKNKKRQLKLS